MPKNIIAEWLNLSSVKFIEAQNNETEVEITVSRLPKLGFLCSCCKKKVFWIWDSNQVRLRDLSIFERKVYLLIHKYRLKCPDCGVKVEELDFASYYSRCTIRFEELVARLCRITSIKQVAELLELDWKTVKEIDKKYLEREFATIDLPELGIIGVDEVSTHKGHSYFTVVMDLKKTSVIWVGKGRKKETLDEFFKELGEERAKKILAIAMDMWDPYIASTKEHAPQAEIVFDKFHVIKNYSKVIDQIRNIEYKKASETEREVIKGTKYLLLRNLEDLKENQLETLDRLLKLNKNINIAYLLKDDLKQLWDYRDQEVLSRFLDSWCIRAKASNIKLLIKFAESLENYRYGLISHAKYPINTSKLEGMNNKIKVLKRVAYGFHDDEYFILKIKQACSGQG